MTKRKRINKTRRQVSNHTHNSHDVNWTLRSLFAAGVLSLCAVASAMSATINASRAEADRQERLALEREAELVTDLANFLAAETAATRQALDGPRLKPAKATGDIISEDDPIRALASFDFAELTVAKADADERRCLAQAIYYEARSEPRIGQLAVADVVLNRVASSLYPNTICTVVFQGSERRTGCQFSFTCDGSMQARLNKRKWTASEELAGAILAGLRAPISRNATHYHANYVTPYWSAKLTPTATIGTHKFYRFPSRTAKTAAPAAM
ncbi:cell wall hydrolase [Hyphococcus flavus]|uniref:Cell wall hydrolase n=1 Tax=Hyphococcus flavus TaxID=1866326 RepID=A0AAE9ZA33_9PROT|nr:cell wall hydrolase [Hyphococcus flavus]WDI30338.1 cell wall hydrolase [Hyphococcus flavus]